MQLRPIRAQIYLPVLRFGITDEDWGFVIGAAVVGYAVPFLTGMKVGKIPLELMSWIALAGVTILLLNLIRRKSRPAWLRHVLQAQWQGAIQHRRLRGQPTRAWLKPQEQP